MCQCHFTAYHAQIDRLTLFVIALCVTKSLLIKLLCLPRLHWKCETNRSCHANGVSMSELLETQPDDSDLCLLLSLLSPASPSQPSSIHPPSQNCHDTKTKPLSLELNAQFIKLLILMTITITALSKDYQEHGDSDLGMSHHRRSQSDNSVIFEH